MAIKNGQTADADEVINAIGANLKTYSNLVWNADLMGFDGDLEEDFGNFVYDTLQDSAKIDTTNSDFTKAPVFSSEIIDECDDSSVDPNLWSSVGGTVTESTAYLRYYSGSNATVNLNLDGVNAPNLNKACTLFLKFVPDNYYSGTGGGSNTCALRLYDGSTYVNLATFAVGDTDTYFFRFEIDPTTNNVDVYANFEGAGSPSTVDISSLSDGASWYFNGYGTNTVGSGTRRTGGYIYFVRLVDGAETGNFISDVFTSASTITNAILVSSDLKNGSSTIDYYLSADNGANYEVVTPNQIHRFTNTGTQLKMKAVLNSTATDTSHLYHYAIQYNYY